MTKRLKMFFKDGSTLILEGCKYIEKSHDKLFLIPHDQDDNIIGYYCPLNMNKYKIEEEDD